MADEHAEALRRLEQRLDRASEKAERLIGAAARIAGAPKPPPAGWEAPAREDRAGSTGRANELETLLAAARAARELIPAEALERFANALRELLLALRALL